MPTFNTTIDDPSPLINYLPPGAWSAGTSSNDPDALQYSNNGTFTLCTQVGATASFSFNGTGVWIFGAKRSNHGPYSVKLDGTTAYGNGYAPDPGLFQTPLFAQSGLQMGYHTVAITNEWTNNADMYLDVDFIIWESEIGTESESINGTIVQDTEPSFTYQPPEAWSTTPPDVGKFNDNTGHDTVTGDAYVVYSFTSLMQGDAVSIFGTAGPVNAPYTAQLDSGSPVTYNATRPSPATTQYQILLFYADNLGAGQHTVKLQNQPSQSGQGLNIDYAVASTVPSVNQIPSQRQGLRGGAIAGIVIAILVVIAGVGFLSFFFGHKTARKTDPSSLSAIPHSRPAPKFMPQKDSRSMSGPNDIILDIAPVPTLPSGRPLPLPPDEHTMQTTTSQIQKVPGDELRANGMQMNGKRDLGRITVHDGLSPPSYYSRAEA